MPLRKATKQRLAALRDGRTYDEVIQDLLAGREPAPSPGVPSKTRYPGEQLALARLAATRWRLAVESGRIVELGPRLVIWNLPTDRERTNANLAYTILEGRGLSA